MKPASKHTILDDYDPDYDMGAVPSPCISICRMDAGSGLCEGCFRTIDEIVQWSHAGDSQKRAVWVEIKRRMEASSPAANQAPQHPV